MSDLKANATNFPIFPGSRSPIVLSTWGRDCLGAPLASGLFGAPAAPASAVWGLANGALYLPFQINESLTLKQIAVLNGTSAADNIDAGVLDENGVRLVSIGSTGRVGTNTPQVFDVTDTPLPPGRYYLGLAMDGTTGSLYQSAAAPNAATFGMLGVAQQGSAFPLPATATFASPANFTRVPFACLSFRATPTP